MSLMNYMKIKTHRGKKKHGLGGLFKEKDDKPESKADTNNLKKRPLHIKLLQKPKEQKGYKKPVVAAKEHRRGALLNKQAKLNPADFYTRDYTIVNKVGWKLSHQIVEFVWKVVRIPPSTDKTLVIPPSFDGWSFLVDFYNPAFAPNVSEQVFKDAIRKINKTLGKAYCTKRNHEYKNMDNFQNSIMLAGLSIMIGGFGLGMYAVLKELSASLFFFVAGGCFAFVLLLSLGLFLSVFIFTQEDKLNEVEIYKRVQATIDTVNSSFRPLGYEWKTTSRFLWLEFYRLGQAQMMPVPSANDLNTPYNNVSQPPNQLGAGQSPQNPAAPSGIHQPPPSTAQGLQNVNPQGPNPNLQAARPQSLPPQNLPPQNFNPQQAPARPQLAPPGQAAAGGQQMGPPGNAAAPYGGAQPSNPNVNAQGPRPQSLPPQNGNPAQTAQRGPTGAPGQPAAQYPPGQGGPSQSVGAVAQQPQFRGQGGVAGNAPVQGYNPGAAQNRGQGIPNNQVQPANGGPPRVGQFPGSQSVSGNQPAPRVFGGR